MQIPLWCSKNVTDLWSPGFALAVIMKGQLPHWGARLVKTVKTPAFLGGVHEYIIIYETTLKNQIANVTVGLPQGST